MSSLQASDAEGILAHLDEEQQAVATAVKGPVSVLAGAGTGKTRAITHRIAYGIATGTYSPDRVLALTFTNRAAGEMKTRLRALGAGTVAASTFHAAALRQLRHFWPLVTGGDAPRVLEGKARILAEAAREVGLKLDPNTLRDVASEVEWRKVTNRTLEAYASIAPSRVLPGSLSANQMLEIMRAYEQLKDDRGQIDFEDVLLLTAGMLANEKSVLMQVHERYRFFVVDEYQDVSPLQHDVLGLWLGNRRELCVVGDASQTIYSFTGATSDYLLNFARDYEDAQLFRLETNYRSTEPIVEAANALMRGRSGALTLHAQEKSGRSPEIVQFPTDVAEAQGIAARIQADIAKGVAPEDIAVLYRINVQSAALEQALTDVNVSYQVHGATRFYDMPEVKQAIMALRAASVAVAGEPLFKSVSDVLRDLGWTQQAPAGTGSVRAKWEALNALMVMADEAPSTTSFRAFTDELLARQEARHEPTLHAVTLASIHSAKGLEWKHVYVVGVSEGLLPISYAQGVEAIAEERRLLYVAMTRAERSLTLSWAVTDPTRQSEREPSRFLAEIGNRTRDVAGSPGVTSDPSAARS